MKVFETAKRRLLRSWSCFCALQIVLFALATHASVSPLVSATNSTIGTIHKLQVSDYELARQIEAQGGRLVADYGAYRLYDSIWVPPSLKANSRAELRDQYHFILLNADQLDTRKPQVKALQKKIGDFPGKHLHLVQFAGPVQSSWREELLATGVQIVSYIPQNTYLVYGGSDSLSRAQKLAATSPQVQWEASYLDDYKIHPKARLTDARGNPRAIGTDLFDIQLIRDSETNPKTLELIDRFKLEPIERQTRVLHYVNIVARLDPGQLAQLAAQPDVIAILPYFPRQKFCERQDQIIAGNLTGTVPSGPGYLAWLGTKGFTQEQFNSSGLVVDISDSGVDNGTTLPVHFGLYENGNTTNASRVVYSRYEQTKTYGTNSLAGCDGHGNINAHIIGGYDDFSGFPFADGNGFHFGLGVCPFVRMGVSVIFDSANSDAFYFPDYDDLESDAYNDGARINANSWGGRNSAGLYDSECQNYDALVRDAQPPDSAYPVDGNQPMVIVFAAGNDGPGPQSVDSPGTAKNVISVGAADSVQQFGGPDRSAVSDAEAVSANDIPTFSSRGPCADGRIKPDLVAPGTHVSGGVAQDLYNLASYPNGIADPCFDASDVSGGPNESPYWPTNQQFYTASSGTSQSTPCVAGGCALLFQYFMNTWSNYPSPAMTKAYLVNSTRYLDGASANDTLPSSNQGMGEMNLGVAFDGVPRILRDQIASDVFTNSGQIRAVTGIIADTNKPFRVTLAWTDAPGGLSGNAYNNDLDLTVKVGGQIYKGNVFNGRYSVTGGVADSENNLESVFLPAGVGENFLITVSATSINSVGIPNDADALNQDFALVVYNATPVARPVITQAGMTLISEGCSPTNGVIDPDETVTVNFGLQNIGTLDVSNLVATLQTNSGVTMVSTSQSIGDLAAAGDVVNIPLTFTAQGACGGSINATIQLQSGTTNFGQYAFNIVLGQLNIAPTFVENFDDVTPPAVPLGWSNPVSNAQPNWVTSDATFDTPPNAAFVLDGTHAGTSELDMPAVAIKTPFAQVTFMNYYDLEANPIDSSSPTTAYDGGALEIRIDDGEFVDILAAGGSFVTGGYTATVPPKDDNPLDGRPTWSGDSGGFVQTIVNLPAAAAGHNIQLRWICGTDTANADGGTGWYIDSISILDGYYSCCSPLVAPTIVSPQMTNSGMSFLFQTVVGQTYSVQYSDDLANPFWITFQSITGDGSVALIVDNPGTQQRFYRIISP